MTIIVKGPLLYAAENRATIDGKTVLILTLKAEHGWPFEARMPFGADGALQAAAYAARLPKGAHITIEAEGTGREIAQLNWATLVNTLGGDACFATGEGTL